MRGLAVRQDMRGADAIVDELQRADGSDLAIEAASMMPRERFMPFLEAALASKPDAERLRLAVEACRRPTPGDRPPQ